MLVAAVIAVLCITILATSRAEASGPYHFCNADGSSRSFNPGNGDPCDSPQSSIFQSVHARVDSGTTASICVVIKAPGGTSVTSVDCSGIGTGSAAARTSPGCNTYYGQIRGNSSNPYSFQGHGWYYKC